MNVTAWNTIVIDMNGKSHLSSLNIVSRGLGYALTSLMALFSGYLLGDRELLTYDALLLLVPWVLSFSFFLAYAICFHYVTDFTNITEKIAKKESFIYTAVISILIAAIIILVYSKFCDSPLSIPLLLSFSLYGFAFVAYGIFLLKITRSTSQVGIRHQLIWPSILSICVSLYFGLYASELSFSLMPLGPLLLVVMFLFVSEIFKFSPKPFALSSLTISLIVLVISALSRFNTLTISSPYDDYLPALVFCLASAAYLAVFEAWRITAYVAASPRTTGDSEVEATHRIRDHFIATTTSLTISSFVIPFAFIFTDYGLLFLFGFVTHAIVSFWYWARMGNDICLLTSTDWVFRKIVFGFLALLILVIDSRYTFKPENRILIGFISFSGLGFLLFVSSYSIVTFIRRLQLIRNDMGEIKFRKVFAKRIYFLRLFIIGSILSCTFILFLQGSTTNPDLLSRSDFTYVALSGMVVICLLFELYHFIFRSPVGVSIARFIVGVAISTRILTSAVIGSVIFIGMKGEGIGAFQAILSSLPFIFLAMGGFALNDVYDFRKDRINKPARAIPRNLLSVAQTRSIAVVFLMASVILAMIVYVNIVAIAIYVIAFTLIIAYNYIVRHLAVMKAFVTGLICSTPFAFLIYNVEYSYHSTFFIPASFLFISGRELYMDICDLKGDKENKSRSFPAIFGIRFTTVVGLFFQALGLAMLLPLVIEEGTFLFTTIFSTATASMVLFTVMWFRADTISRRKIVIGYWLPMVLGSSLIFLG